MKKITTTLLTCITVIIGTYVGFWYLAANHLQKNIAEILAQNNQHFCMQHDGISLKGFPFAVEAIIKNPTFTNKASAGCWTRAATMGTVTVGTPLLNNKGWIEVSGNTIVNIIGPLGETLTISGALRYETNQFKEFKESLEQINIDLNMWEINGFTFSAEKLAITADSQPLIEVDHLKWECEKIQATAPYITARRFNFDTIGYLCHYKQWAKLDHSENRLAWNLCDMLSSKTDSSLAVRVQLLHSKDEASSCSLDIEKWTTVNALCNYAFQGKLEAENVISSNPRFSVSFNAKHIISDAFTKRFLPCLQELAKLWHDKGYFAESPELETLFTKHWDQVANYIAESAIYNPFETQVDVTCQSRKDAATQEELDWSCDLKKLAVKVGSYEIDFQGNKEFRDFPQSSLLKIRITNYQSLIQKLANSYNRLQSLLTSTQTFSQAEMPPINHSVIAHITNFFISLSQSTNDRLNDFQITVQGSNKNDIRVGGLNDQQLQAAFDQLTANITSAMYTQSTTR
jgi:hypothetical protein